MLVIGSAASDTEHRPPSGQPHPTTGRLCRFLPATAPKRSAPRQSCMVPSLAQPDAMRPGEGLGGGVDLMSYSIQLLLVVANLAAHESPQFSHWLLVRKSKRRAALVVRRKVSRSSPRCSRPSRACIAAASRVSISSSRVMVLGRSVTAQAMPPVSRLRRRSTANPRTACQGRRRATQS